MPSHHADVLQAVVRGTANATGRPFFRSLTRSLAEALDVAYCFVTECIDTPSTRVATLAFWSDGALTEDFAYDLVKTPCEQVIRGDGVCYGQDVQQLFPEDQDLVDLEAQSYAAVPLIDSAEDIVGHLVILDRQPFGDRPPDLPLLEIFAARAAAELERQRTTTALANSEARLRQVIDLVPHFVFAKDRDGRFILVNQSVAEAYGTTVSELTGKTDADFASSPAEAEQFRQADLEVIESGEVKTIAHEVVTDARGRTRHLQTIKIPFTFANSDLPSVLGVSIDVTEQRRGEKRLRAVVEGTAGAIGDAFHRALVENLARAFETRFALVAEIEGERATTRALWAGDRFLEGITYGLEDAPCGRTVASAAVTRIRDGLRAAFPDRPYGDTLDADSYLGVPLVAADGRTLGILALLDIAPLTEHGQDDYLLTVFASRAAAEIEREQVEAHRRHLQAQVLHVQKLESLGVLAGGIAHDFNNLLCGILGNVDLARSDNEPGCKPETYLTEIERAASRAAELSGQMLAYSGKGTFVVRPFDLNQLIEEMTGLLRTSISKKARLDLELGPSLPAMVGDPTQIYQVLMNLVINASDAIGDAPGAIRVRTGQRRVHTEDLESTVLAEDLADGPCLFVEIEDDGCGMDAITRSRLFDPFFTTKTTGRGLGLAALLGIVRGHHGAVQVSSREGEGSTFTLFFPVKTPAVADEAQPAPAREATTDRAHGTILFVDDEEIMRSLGRKALTAVGFEVQLASDGREAIEYFRRHASAISAVVLDMMMPELDGLETFHELRRIDPDVKVVLSSGFTREAMAASLRREGLAGFLKKPYRPSALTRQLIEIVEDLHADQERTNQPPAR